MPVPRSAARRACNVWGAREFPLHARRNERARSHSALSDVLSLSGKELVCFAASRGGELPPCPASARRAFPRARYSSAEAPADVRDEMNRRPAAPKREHSWGQAHYECTCVETECWGGHRCELPRQIRAQGFAGLRALRATQASGLQTLPRGPAGAPLLSLQKPLGT